MFQEYNGFTRTPFSKTIETDKLFSAAGQKELAARLTHQLRERGFGLGTGEICSGKSTAVRAFTASLDATSYLVIYRQSYHWHHRRLPRPALDPRPRAAVHQAATMPTRGTPGDSDNFRWENIQMLWLSMTKL